MKKGLCAALGDYDGVHPGHIAVIKTAVDSSKDLIPTIYTFTNNCKNSKIITDNETKSEIFKNLGIKKIIFEDFDSIKNYSPLQFVEEILIKKYNVKTIVCGSDFTFGKNAKGNIDTLKHICDNLKLNLKVVDAVKINNSKISSSLIRQYIENGQVDCAREIMGRNYNINGIVQQGKHLGKTMQTPTININFNKMNVIPKYGVYITKTYVNDKCYKSISNVGIRPSVETTDIPNVETYIFDFDQNIYGKPVTIEFIKMIRPEIKFKNSSMLYEQVEQDILNAKSYFNGEN